MKTAISYVVIYVLLVNTMFLVVEPAKISIEDDNMNIVRLSYASYNEGDWSSFAKLHSPGYLQHAPDYEKPISWIDYELSARIAHRRLPDLKYRIEDIFAVKDKVASRIVWEFHGGKAFVKRSCPDGIVKGSLISISLIRDGNIIEEWLEYDPYVVNNLKRYANRMEHIK